MEEGRNWGGYQGWGRGILSKALPVRRGDRSRKRRSPKLAIFKSKGKALWSPPLSLKSLNNFAKSMNCLGNSLCLHFLCTQISQEVQPKPCWEMRTFPSKSATSFNKAISMTISVTSQMMSFRERSRREKEGKLTMVWGGSWVWHTGNNSSPWGKEEHHHRFWSHDEEGASSLRR